MATTDTQMLAAVKDLILDLLTTGRGIVEYSFDGRRARKFDLEQLRELEKELTRRVNSASRTTVLLADISGGDS